MDFENEIDLNELSERINNLRELEDQENSPGLPDEYRNMDKLTIIKMLLASQHENEKLHARLDKQDEEAKAREERLNVRIDELTRVNTISSESQIKLMDQLTELHHQLKQMGGQYSDLLVELKRQKDLNRQSGKEKYATTKQNVKKDDQDKDDSDDGQRGNRVRQADDFNGDPKTLKDVCNDVPQTPKDEKKTKEIREYRQGMKYNKSINTKVYHHNFDMTKLPEGGIVIKHATRRLKSVKLVMSVHEYDWCKVKFPDGRIEWLYLPEDARKSDCIDEEYESHREYKPFGNTELALDSIPTLALRDGDTERADELALDSIPTLAYMRYGLSTPANRIADMLKESGLGGCRQSVINWLQDGGNQLAYLLPSLKEKLLNERANLNCDETWGRLRLQYKAGYKKVYVWCMVNKKEKIVYYFFDKPKEGTRSREVLKQFLGDTKIKSLQSDGYVGYVFLDDDLVDIEHIYCLAHVRAKFVVAYNIGKVKEALQFIEWIQELYKLEKLYKKLNLTPEQIKERRNNVETSEIIQKMKNELDRLWPEDKQKQSKLDPVFATALRYLYNQWDGLMNYRNDGEYSIDNNIAERNVRPATVERKNSLSFASEDGIECSATYHTIVQTCRMMGVRVLKYFQSFFKTFKDGCSDFMNMLPGKLAID